MATFCVLTASLAAHATEPRIPQLGDLRSNGYPLRVALEPRIVCACLDPPPSTPYTRRVRALDVVTLDADRLRVLARWR